MPRCAFVFGWQRQRTNCVLLCILFPTECTLLSRAICRNIHHCVSSSGVIISTTHQAEYCAVAAFASNGIRTVCVSRRCATTPCSYCVGAFAKPSALLLFSHMSNIESADVRFCFCCTCNTISSCCVALFQQSARFCLVWLVALLIML